MLHNAEGRPAGSRGCMKRHAIFLASLALLGALSLAAPAAASPGVCAGEWQALGGSCTVDTHPIVWFESCGGGWYYATSQTFVTRCIFYLP